MQGKNTTGKVILAGAGPGDADLITIKLSKALQQADVIVTDRLVNPAIIEEYKKPGAEVILAGKQGYNKLSLTQDEVSSITVEYALQGKNVLRLKGGDVAIYSNVMDELFALRNYNIPFEIIPGITAASGASAYAGIPLTARGHSSNVRFILYDDENTFTTNEWVCLGSTSDTLVLYMGIKKLPSFLKQLRKYTGETNKNIAIVEQASTVYQRVHTFSLQDDESNWLPENFQTPGLVIIGSVVSLHESFNWFETLSETGSIFKKLETEHKQ